MSPSGPGDDGRVPSTVGGADLRYVPSHRAAGESPIKKIPSAQPPKKLTKRPGK
jgi:hypothetical protein